MRIMHLFKKLVLGCDYENHTSPDIPSVSRAVDPDVGVEAGVGFVSCLK